MDRARQLEGTRRVLGRASAVAHTLAHESDLVVHDRSLGVILPQELIPEHQAPLQLDLGLSRAP